MVTMADFKTDQRPTWCPGCGDFAVLASLQRAAANLQINPDEMVVVGGIGCSGKLPQHFGSYGFHGLHGRSIPVATGVKMSRPELTVVAAGGDGDGYGIGLGHLLHAVRRNVDITYIVMDNHIYGLTTGQASPTSDVGHKTKTSPRGAVELPINPLALALSAGVSFLAQGFSGNAKQLSELMEKAIQHRGFALVNVFSPCVTFNKQNTYDWYRENIINLDEEPRHDLRDRAAAVQTVLEMGSHCTGVIFQDDSRPAYHEALHPDGYDSTPFIQPELSFDSSEFRQLLQKWH